MIGYRLERRRYRIRLEQFTLDTGGLNLQATGLGSDWLHARTAHGNHIRVAGRTTAGSTGQSVSVVATVNWPGQVKSPGIAARRSRHCQVCRIGITDQRATLNSQSTAVAAPVAGHPEIRLDRIHRELCRLLHACDRLVNNECLSALVVDLEGADDQE